MEEEKDPMATEEETEEASGGDKTPEEKNEGTDKDEKGKKEKPTRSDIIQKRKFRERAERAEKSVEELKTELASLKDLIKKPTNEDERKAQEYIRSQARQVFEELQKTQKSEEEADERELQRKIDDALEGNPDIPEEELLDVMEEYEVEPDVALRILKKQSTANKPKPKMPQPKRGSGGGEPAKKPDDSKKNMWQIAQEEIQRLKDKTE